MKWSETSAEPMSPRVYRARGLVTAIMLGLSGALMPNQSDAEVSYTYDPLGRVTMALYDNGFCVSYTYDPDGNRIGQNNAVAQPVWGSSVWRCVHWTAQSP